MFFVKTPAFLKPLYKDLIWEIKDPGKEIYLTFDDGPTPGVTEQVLDLLSEYNALATFFCIGDKVNRYGELYARITGEGHATGNHTWSHLNGWSVKDERYVEDVNRCSELVKSDIFRPPYGKITRSQVKILRNDFKIIMWDVLSGDFDQEISPERCLKNVIENTREGSIVVFHDSEKAANNLLYALPRVLEHFSAANFSFNSLKTIS